MKKPKRKLVVSGINDCMRQLRAALDAVDMLNAETVEVRNKLVAERSQRIAAEEETKKTRANFNDLKTRLHNAELETSRLNGYMQRVREDDNVADPLIEIIDASGTHRVSKRWPSNSMQFGAASNNAAGNDYITDNYGNRQKKEHWITY